MTMASAHIDEQGIRSLGRVWSTLTESLVNRPPNEMFNLNAMG